MRNLTLNTALPWRAGDAGYTVFGPPNGNPCPEVVAECRYKANAALIVRAVNSHEALLAALNKAANNAQFVVDHHDEFRRSKSLHALQDIFIQIRNTCDGAIKLAEEGREP